MRKNIIFALILSVFLIPTFCYASTSYEDAGFYAPFRNGSDNCSTNGKYNWTDANSISVSGNITYNLGTKNVNNSAKAKSILLYVKRDLEANKTYDFKLYATGKNFYQSINVNSIHFYDVDTACEVGSESNSIALVSLSNKASTGEYVSSITIRLTSTQVHANWVIEIVNSEYKNITTSNWGIKNLQWREVDMTGTNSIIENNTINNNNLINSNTQNTQDIIDNNNKNTQDIIDNNNRLAEEQKELQQNCDLIDISDIVYNSKYLDNSGNLQNTSSVWGVTDYINIYGAKMYMLEALGVDPKYCFYDKNRVKITCASTGTLVSELTIPTNAYYFRTSIQTQYNKPTFKYCKNGNQAIVDTFTDDSIPTGNDYFDDFNDMLPSNNTISSLIGLPISLYTKVLNSINGTCSAMSLGNLYNTDLIMPCIDISSYLGSALWTTIDLIMSGGFVLVISKKMVKAFHSFTDMKDGDVINND